MNRYRSSMRQFAWVAIFALLLASFGSTATRVLAQVSGVPATMGEVCAVAVDPAISVAGHAVGSTQPFDGDERAQHGTAECPYCVTHAFSFALASAASEAVAPVAHAVATVSNAPLLPRSPELALGATPRGPPLAS